LDSAPPKDYCGLGIINFSVTAALSPDGARAAIQSHDWLWLFDVDSNKLLKWAGLGYEVVDAVLAVPVSVAGSGANALPWYLSRHAAH
jgi:hypothetical protein